MPFSVGQNNVLDVYAPRNSDTHKSIMPIIITWASCQHITDGPVVGEVYVCPWNSHPMMNLYPVSVGCITDDGIALNELSAHPE